LLWEESKQPNARIEPRRAEDKNMEEPKEPKSQAIEASRLNESLDCAHAEDGFFEILEYCESTKEYMELVREGKLPPSYLQAKAI